MGRRELRAKMMERRNVQRKVLTSASKCQYILLRQ